MEAIKPYAIVLAGGRGSRLPIAGSTPKQFAPKFNGVTFVQDVIKMITYDVIKPSRVIVVVTNDEMKDFAIEQLTPYKVPSTNVVMFDPHLGYVAVMAAAADYISKIEPKAVAFITPSDSHIEGQEELTNAICTACNEANNGRSILVGAKVADANIVGGCGNAQYDSSEEGPFYEILDFIEKPAKFGPDRVKQILMDDNTVVNTGLYAVRVDKFCKVYPMEKINELLKKYYDEGSEKTDLGLDPTDMVKKLNMKLLSGGFE
jgi:mannose-1-phosphate guanylyltransferase